MTAAHPCVDHQKGITYNFVLDFPRGGGLFTLFAAPEDPAEKPYVLAKINELPAYIHRHGPCVLYTQKVLHLVPDEILMSLEPGDFFAGAGCGHGFGAPCAFLRGTIVAASSMCA